MQLYDDLGARQRLRERCEFVGVRVPSERPSGCVQHELDREGRLQTGNDTAPERDPGIR